MKRFSRAVASSSYHAGRVSVRSTRLAIALPRQYTTSTAAAVPPQEEEPLTSLTVTPTGVKIKAHGVNYEMDFLADLPADAKEILSGEAPTIQSTSEFIAKWGKEAPELADAFRALDATIARQQNSPLISFNHAQAFLRDLVVEKTLHQATLYGDFVESLLHFWSAYAEIPAAGSKTREPAVSPLERAKAFLQNKEDPVEAFRKLRSRITIAASSYLGSKSADVKAAAAAVLLEPAKAQALKSALKSARSDAEKETIIKQHLQWDEATKAASELIQKHPEFTELNTVLSQFPPLVFHIGEPSTAAYRMKHFVDKVYQKWLATKPPITTVSQNVEDPALEKVRDLSIASPLPFDYHRAQELQHTIPGLLFSQDLSAFSLFLNNDAELNDFAQETYQLSLKEFPNNPELVLTNDLINGIELIKKQFDEKRELEKEWTAHQMSIVNSKIQAGIAQLDKFVNGTMHDILADHPEWEKEIEEDIANHRWDPEVDKKEYERTVKEYYAHHSVHA